MIFFSLKAFGFNVSGMSWQQFVSSKCESSDSLIQVCFAMARGNLDSNSRLTLSNHRVEKSDRKHIECQQTLGHFLSKYGVTQHDRYDRVVPLGYCKAMSLHLSSKVMGVFLELVAKRC